MEQITDGVLENLITRYGPVDIVWGGFDCRALSRAGQGRGFKDRRLKSFFDLVRVINWCQNKQQGHQVWYFCENTWPGTNVKEGVREAFEMIEMFLGRGALVDAADLGSAAHRVRFYWTNIVESWKLPLLIPSGDDTQSPPALDTILESYHTPAPVFHDDKLPFSPLNTTGNPRVCLPTLMSTIGSWAFRTQPDGSIGPGQLWNEGTHQWEEPNLGERELMMGMWRGASGRGEGNEQVRHKMLGQAMGHNVMRWVGGIMAARWSL